MAKKRRRFTDKFKAKVALEAVKGLKTLSELATEYQVHPNQISEWKQQLITNAPALFASGKKKRVKTEEELIAPLYEEIGRLKMDLKWLKKSCEPAAFKRYPEFGYRRMTDWLRDEGHMVNYKRVARLMQRMGAAGNYTGTSYEQANSRPQNIPVFTAWHDN